MDDYNKIANEYEAYGKEATTDIEIGYKNVLKSMGDVRGKRVLDYGCGVGKFSRILKDLGAEVVGVDIAEKELLIAQKQNLDIEFLTIKEAEEKFKNFFDWVVINFVITAIPSTDAIDTVFTNIYRFTKDEGKLVMLNSNYEKSGNCNFLSFKIGDVKKEIGAPLSVSLGHTYDLLITDFYYSQEFYVDALEKAGFRTIEIVEPLADTSDYPWKDEKNSPPFIIISAVKERG